MAKALLPMALKFFVRAHKTERGIQTFEILSITAWAEFKAFGI